MSETAKKPSGNLSARLSSLQVELEASVGEAEWLKSHYEEQLRVAFAQIASLQARVREHKVAQETAAPQDVLPRAKIEQLQREIRRLLAAEACYLDRIEELKDELARAQG